MLKRKRSYYMNHIKIGDKLKIECFKHNGYLDRTSDEATVVYFDSNVLVVANDHTRLTEHNGTSHCTKEPAILFFYKKKWFNIIGQLKKSGLFYYCNIATPYIIDGKSIKYIDYDLDLRVYPDGGFKVLDRNEYRYHKKIMKYGPLLDSIIQNSLSELIEMKRKDEGPFQKNVVDNYYEVFQNLKSK